MIVAEEALVARARRTYEAGRLRWALVRTVAALAIATVAMVGCPAPGGPAACAATLGALLAACLWRGGSWARGARLGSPSWSTRSTPRSRTERFGVVLAAELVGESIPARHTHGRPGVGGSVAPDCRVGLTRFGEGSTTTRVVIVASSEPNRGLWFLRRRCTPKLWYASSATRRPSME